jgi:hypothetical protein
LVLTSNESKIPNEFTYADLLNGLATEIRHGHPDIRVKEYGNTSFWAI